jgi:hypothetical protein
MAWRNIYIDGIYIKPSKSGKTFKIAFADWEENLEELKKALERKPEWKTRGFSEKEREFYINITNGSMGEVWDDDDDRMPPDYGEPKGKKKDETADDEKVPF